MTFGKEMDDLKTWKNKIVRGSRGLAVIKLDTVVGGLLPSNVKDVGVGVGNELGPDIHFHKENTNNV